MIREFFKNLCYNLPCPDCGRIVACPRCSELMDYVDEDIDKNEREWLNVSKELTE